MEAVALLTTSSLPQAVQSGDPTLIRHAQMNIARRRAGLKTPIGATPQGFGTSAFPGSLLRTPAGLATPGLTPAGLHSQEAHRSVIAEHALQYLLSQSLRGRVVLRPRQGRLAVRQGLEIKPGALVAWCWPSVYTAGDQPFEVRLYVAGLKTLLQRRNSPPLLTTWTFSWPTTPVRIMHPLLKLWQRAPSEDGETRPGFLRTRARCARRSCTSACWACRLPYNICSYFLHL